MIKEAFDRIFLEYTRAMKQRFAGHQLASFVRNDVSGLFVQAFPGDTDLKWEELCTPFEDWKKGEGWT